MQQKSSTLAGKNLLIKDSVAALNRAPLESCSAKVFFRDNFIENVHKTLIKVKQ